MITSEHSINRNPLTVVSTAAVMLSTIGGVVGDFFYPLAPYGFWIFLVLMFLIVLSIAMRAIPPIDRILSKMCNGYWYLAIFIGLLASALIFLGCYLVSKSSDQEGERGRGFFANQLPEVKQLQTSLLSIEKDIKDISRNTAISADANVKTAEEIVTLKKETSENPRKELANLGIQWSHEGFFGALQRSDEYAVDLFIQGGMRFSPPDPDNDTLANLIDSNKYSFSVIKKLVDSDALDIKQITRKYKYWTFQEHSRALKERLHKIQGASPDRVNEIDFSIVMPAIWSKQEELANYLIELGADTNKFCGGFSTDYTKKECVLIIDPIEEAKELGVTLSRM